VYQLERAVEGGVKQSERNDLKFLIPVFRDVTLFELVRGDLREKNNSFIFRIKQYKEKGFLK